MEERNNGRPVFDNQAGNNRADNPKEKAAGFRYFFSMFCGGLIGSLLGTLLFKFFTLLFQL